MQNIVIIFNIPILDIVDINILNCIKLDNLAVVLGKRAIQSPIYEP